jgi:hypothetical protein
MKGRDEAKISPWSSIVEVESEAKNLSSENNIRYET